MPTSAINNSSTHKLISYVEVDNALAKPITKMNFDPPKLEGGVGSGLPILQQLKVHIVNQRILAEIIEGKHKALPADKLAILDLRTKSKFDKQQIKHYLEARIDTKCKQARVRSRSRVPSTYHSQNLQTSRPLPQRSKRDTRTKASCIQS
jgi:hypothetical protein